MNLPSLQPIATITGKLTAKRDFEGRIWLHFCDVAGCSDNSAYALENLPLGFTIPEAHLAVAEINATRRRLGLKLISIRDR